MVALTWAFTASAVRGAVGGVGSDMLSKLTIADGFRGCSEVMYLCTADLVLSE